MLFVSWVNKFFLVRLTYGVRQLQLLLQLRQVRARQLLVFYGLPGEEERWRRATGLRLFDIAQLAEIGWI